VPDSFPRRQARTRRFTLGAPRSLTISPDGERVVLLRSRGGTDPLTCLWTLDVATGEERLVADPAELSGPDGDADLPPEERARRERSREQAGGVVGYATDRPVTMAAFALGGQLYVTEFAAGLTPRLAETPGGVIDPRPDPTGRRVAFVSGGAVHVHDVTARTTTPLVEPEADGVTYGLADFAAAEEMGRMRGFWWSPDGEALLVARVDTAPVRRWWIADPEHPERPPAAVAYPAAGTPNAVVTLEIVRLDGTRTPVAWGDEEYLATAAWDDEGPLLSVQPRDQTRLRVVRADPGTGAVRTVHEQADPAWVDIVPGVPAVAAGELVTVEARDGAYRLVVGGEPVTAPDLQVREVLDVDGDTVLLAASDDPVSMGVWRWSRAGGVEPVAVEPGVHSGRLAGGTLVLTRRDLHTDGARTTVHRGGTEREVVSHAEAPGLVPSVAMLAVGERALRAALLLPTGHVSGTPLPVLMDPYGGPHAQRVVAHRAAFQTSQWFADQGFAVVVVDGRGTPGRGPEFERAVHGDLAAPVLQDQVDALHAIAADHPDLDLTRVGIRGWSFGGYLAALAVLRRPDVFHAAVAGAPVTDWALYDTHYTERYLGRPDTHPEAYARSSLLTDAPALERPLLLVHGLADDNVVAAHTLTLSSALLAAGRPHSVLPLSGVTHMTPQEVVAENLLLLQVRFLQESLRARARAEAH
jgi:dipeptidyl-peptidase 4